MRKWWRPLALAAVLNVMAGVAVGSAQTVMVRNAPPGTTVEVVLNTATVGSAIVDMDGNATVAADLSTLGKTETDAYVYVDLCDNRQRVLILERGAPVPPQEPGCDRRESLGLFLVRRVSTLVLDVADSRPTVMLRRGPVTFGPPREPASAPGGLVLSGAGSFATFRDTTTLACGNVLDCSGDSSRLAYAVGGSYWITRFLAAEASYLKPSELPIRGGDETFRFTSFLNPHVLTVAAKVGVPVGRVRFYGKAGGNHHWATMGTAQTIDDITVTIEDIPQIIPGGTQNLELRTSGWGWLFGGGGEVWARPAFALYGEVARTALKGPARDDKEGALDERVNVILFGARFRLGG